MSAHRLLLRSEERRALRVLGLLEVERQQLERLLPGESWESGHEIPKNLPPGENWRGDGDVGRPPNQPRPPPPPQSLPLLTLPPLSGHLQHVITHDLLSSMFLRNR